MQNKELNVWKKIPSELKVVHFKNINECTKKYVLSNVM